MWKRTLKIVLSSPIQILSHLTGQMSEDDVVFSQESMTRDKQLIVISNEVVLVPYLPRHVVKYNSTSMPAS